MDESRFRMFIVPKDGDYSPYSTDALQDYLEETIRLTNDMRATGKFKAEVRANEKTIIDMKNELLNREEETTDDTPDL